MRDHFHHTLRFLRLLHGKKLRDICEEANCSWQHLQFTETGKRKVSMDLLDKILPVYGLEYDEFFVLDKIVAKGPIQISKMLVSQGGR